MSYGAYLKDLLAPLGVYDQEGTVNGGELECIGAEMPFTGRQLDGDAILVEYEDLD